MQHRYEKSGTIGVAGAPFRAEGPASGVLQRLLQGITVAGACFFGTIARAEERIISGLGFPVDEVVTLDAKSVRVTIKGRSQLVAPSQVDTLVLTQGLADTEWLATIPFESFRAFVEHSIRAVEHDPAATARAVEAVVALWKIPQATDEGIIDTLLAAEKQLPRAGVRRIFQESLPRIAPLAEHRGAYATLFLLSGFDDSDWVRTRMVAQGLQLGATLRDAGRTLFQKALVEGAYDRAASIAECLSTIFGADDQEAGRYRAILSRVRDVTAEIARDDTNRLYAITEIPISDPLEERALVPILREFLHRKIAQALDGGDLDQAFGMLSRIKFDWRTPTTHAQMLRAVQQLTPSNEPPLISRPIEMSVRRFAAKDPAIHEAYRQFLEAQIDFLRSAGRFREVDYYFGLLRLLRPDPNPDNDALRVSLAVAHALAGTPAQGRILMEESQTGIAWYQWLRFYGAVLFADAERLITIALAILGTLVLIRLLRSGAPERWASALTARSYAQRRNVPVEEEPESERPQGFSYVTKSRPLTPTQQEYLRCLHILGLSADASVSEIKSAYRKRIKLTHPDAAIEHSPKSAAEFVEITRAYDRLLELRAEMGLRDQ